MDDKKLVTSNKEVSEKNRRHFKYRSNECLNCGQPLDLSDVYCPYCSQLNSTKQLSLKDFFGEFLNSIVSYDSRLRHTIKDLLFRPGVATRNYAKGQRLRYANPFRFFLSVSIIYFLLNGLIMQLYPDGQSLVKINNESDAAETTSGDSPFRWSDYDDDSDVSIVPVTDTLAIDPQEEAEITAMGATGDSLTSEVPAKKKKKTKDKPVDYISETDLDTLSLGEQWFTRYTLYADFYERSDIKNSAEALDSLRHENTRTNRWLYQRTQSFDSIQEDPRAYFSYMLQKTPFFIFFFTPLYALFFWLIYSKKRFSYVEHMVFIFHVFSFVFMGLLITLLPDLLLGNDVFQAILFGLIGPFYFYKALRNFYKDNRLITIVKFVFLNIVFWIGASITAAIFFIITAATY